MGLLLPLTHYEALDKRFLSLGLRFLVYKMSGLGSDLLAQIY